MSNLNPLIFVFVIHVVLFKYLISPPEELYSEYIYESSSSRI